MSTIVYVTPRRTTTTGIDPDLIPGPPPRSVTVLEALELLESRGEASSGVRNGEVVWTVNRPPPKPKAEKKQAPKKAKKTSEVRA